MFLFQAMVTIENNSCLKFVKGSSPYDLIIVEGQPAADIGYDPFWNSMDLGEFNNFSLLFHGLSFS